jgi:hypothetical protein
LAGFYYERKKPAMSTAIPAREKSEDTNAKFEAFVRDLTELSLRHRIGIAGDPVLFILEDVDLDRTYACDADSALVY